MFMLFRSIKEKAEFIKRLDLGGAMIWSIETDDFRGICGAKYPLLKTINHVLRDDEPLPPTPPPSNMTTTTTTPGTNAKCEGPGYMRDPYDCSVFYYCQTDGEHGYKQHKFTCPPGLVYDTKTNVCAWPYETNCEYV